MEFDHNNVIRVVEEDRLSTLPDELIHMILSSFDMKFVVQTSLLSSRWKLLWTSMPCLNFSNWQFRNLLTFANFVSHVLSHRNHQVEVSSVKLDFYGAYNHGFVSQIAEYAFSHNVQQLTVVSSFSLSDHREYPPCLFSSQSLKHFTLTSYHVRPCITTETPWEFPALTTLNLSYITLRYNNLFTNCVNLKNLTLKHFSLEAIEVLDIITPRLSNLTLIKGRGCKVMNVIAPQLENLTVVECSIEYLNAPPGISSLCYSGCHPMQLCKDGFHCLNKVSICFTMMYRPYKEEDAHKTINMFQEVHSARNLTLNVDIVECLSLFPDLLSHHPSPFGNLSCLTIDYTNTERKDAHKVTMSDQVKNFLLENSLSTTITMNHPKVPSIRL